MPIRQMAIAAAFAAGLAAVPVSAAQAQYYPPCSPFPLFWPFCAAGALVGAAATIVTAPFWALTGTPPVRQLSDMRRHPDGVAATALC